MTVTGCKQMTRSLIWPLISALIWPLVWAPIWPLICVPVAASAEANNNSTRCTVEARILSQAKDLYHARQYLLAAVSFTPLRVAECDTALTSQAWLGYAHALFELHETGETLRTIELALAANEVLPTDRNKLAVLKSFAQMDPAPGLSTLQRERWDLWKLRDDPVAFGTQLQKAPESLKPTDAQTVHDAYAAFRSQPRKNLFAAGTASAILPGAGQVYAGDYQAAALSFVINALFIATTVELAKKNMPASAAASGGIFSITYVGNILSAVKGARAYNASHSKESESNLKMILFPELEF
jgi:hypothetical protein